MMALCQGLVVMAAPGGDGYPGEGPRESPWVPGNAENWKYSLLCPILPSRKYPDGLALWIGTSFSTPLVSGLAALILEAPPGPRTPVMTDMIAAQPSADLALGEGTVDVPESLQP